jgi:hypothetical protein
VAAPCHGTNGSIEMTKQQRRGLTGGDDDAAIAVAVALYLVL